MVWRSSISPLLLQLILISMSGLYISDLGKRSLEKDFMALIFGRPIAQHCIRISDDCENVLEVDTALAWKESGSSAGWSNEVAIEIVIR